MGKVQLTAASFLSELNVEHFFSMRFFEILLEMVDMAALYRELTQSESVNVSAQPAKNRVATRVPGQ